MTSRHAGAEGLTFAIGDVHGCKAELVTLLGKCRDYAGGNAARYVFIGDYIDRGPNSAAAIATIRELADTNPQEVICLMGNHEDLLIEALDTGDPMNWLHNGADATLESYGVTTAEQIPDADRNWVRSLRLSYDDGKRFFVHAGIEPGIPLDEQERDALMWIREPFLSSTKDHGRLIVHGHTPQRSGRPEVRSNRVNIDTACVYGGALTAAVFIRTVMEPVDFVRVTSNCAP